MVTKNTLNAEVKRSDLSGNFIDKNITMRELSLRSGSININSDILNDVLSCKMYTTNYPLLNSHIMNEAKMYYYLLEKVENRNLFTENELYEQELFWNNIMKEHAEFIRGLLDPSEEELILTADNFADEYKEIIKNYSNNPAYLTNVSLNETINLRDFKVSGEEGILNCKIKSIIIPLLADHVVREANHFIRILRNLKI